MIDIGELLCVRWKLNLTNIDHKKKTDILTTYGAILSQSNWFCAYWGCWLGPPKETKQPSKQCISPEGGAKSISVAEKIMAKVH